MIEEVTKEEGGQRAVVSIDSSRKDSKGGEGAHMRRTKVEMKPGK